MKSIVLILKSFAVYYKCDSIPESVLTRLMLLLLSPLGMVSIEVSRL